MQTKDDLIKALDDAAHQQAKLASHIEELGKEAQDQKAQIVTLKKVATFYRAQRDRVDAYLSAVLDVTELQQRGTMDYDTGPITEFHEVGAMVAERATEHAPKVERGRRPKVQEPFVSVNDPSDGRAFANYRDIEYPQDWENF